MALKKRKAVKKKAVRKKIIKKKAVKKKPAKKKALKKKPVSLEKIYGKALGEITHYFPKVRAAVVKVATVLSCGDNIKVKGHTTDFTQTISSMQIDHIPVTSAKKGDEIGLLVNSRVRQGDKVYKG